MQETSFKPTLGLADATMIVAGSMIGSGIFIVSADMLKDLGSSGWMITAWLLTGLMTLIAAVSYGELSAMFPKAGGQYVYLKEAYNPLTGFLYGWSFFAVIQTGTIAAVAVAFSKFAGYFIPALEMTDANILFKIGSLPIYLAQIVAILLIVLLTYTNTLGVQGGKWIQNIFTSAKLIALFGLIGFGIAAIKPSVLLANWADAWSFNHLTKTTSGTTDIIKATPIIGAGIIGAMASAMVGSIFSSDAWNNVTFIAGEIKNPKRNIGLSLLLGTILVTIIYVSCNLIYISILPIHEIAFAPQNRVAVAVAKEIFGNNGTYIIAALIMVSTFGCNNGLILAGARVYHTMAVDGLFFKQATALNAHAVPNVALWLQCVVACLLCISGQYGNLLDMVSFVVVLFYILTIYGIFRLRKKMPNADRPYKAFGYPILPIIYILMASIFCIGLIWIKPDYAGWGLAITLAGIPLYYLAMGNKKTVNG